MTVSMSVEERERLAEQYAVELAPKLRNAIDRRDAARIAELLSGLDHQRLLVLVVALASQWPVRRPRRLVTCWNCQGYKRDAGNGLCRACLALWDDTGRADSGPRRPMTREEISRLGVQARRERRAARVEDCAELISWGVDHPEALAGRLGVSVWTASRYKADLEKTP